MPTPEELLEQVADRETFVAFVRALAEERQEAEQMERAEPVRHQLGGAKNWQNSDISSFLYAALDYFTEKPFHQPAEVPSWGMLAEFLYFRKVIE